MLSLHPLKSSFEAISFVGIGLLAQLGPLIYQGVLFTKAISTLPPGYPSVYRKISPTRTTSMISTKTLVMPVQSSGGASGTDMLCILITVIAIAVYYGGNVYKKGRPPLERPPKQPSDQTPSDSSGSSPPTPPPDAGADSDSIPLPNKRGWPWFWIFLLLSNLFSFVLIWFYWPRVRMATIFGILLTLSSTFLFFAGPIASIIVTIRRKVKKHFIRTRRCLSDYFSHTGVHDTRVKIIYIDVLSILWSSVYFLVPAMACIGTFRHVLFKFSPEIQQFATKYCTSTYAWYIGRCISWFITQITWQQVVYIVSPTASVVLLKLHRTYLDERLDTLSDLATELVEKNQIAEQQKQAFQVSAPSHSDGSRARGTFRGLEASLDNENTKDQLEDQQQEQSFYQRVIDPPDALTSHRQEELVSCTAVETTTISILQIQIGEEAQAGMERVVQCSASLDFPPHQLALTGVAERREVRLLREKRLLDT
ncbi:hypothetical protein BDZ94DRAFT_677308 [Collybia nuda]|uniref:Uncharacterized protein n=1 Tax=Collybia nuda TaxID=64659 RepID=A0A9P5YH62_9AGAR|nr:hypothetical protein BDZ94DRAFT_677308 [Collybia nuda]